ncbi:unnamed protein product [Calicophoron daubneyi]|uniref:Uncharacterized protein n=1 Tax=Calicophoron daubneyi TaxID=300641 RepID=A0AAV2TAC5_CALDB
MPKSGVKQAKPKPEVDTEHSSSWKEKLCSYELTDETWNPSVSFVVPSTIYENEVLRILESAVLEGKRQFFSVVSYNDVISQVFQYGSSKYKKTKDTPMFSELFQMQCLPKL